DWTQAAFDGLEAGLRSVSTNGANDAWTAIGAEVISIDSDTPAAAAVRPTAHSFAMGSSQAGIY
ncbi:hypothetical protein LCGC14_2473840, partial [marine sediment metagenome]